MHIKPPSENSERTQTTGSDVYKWENIKISL